MAPRQAPVPIRAVRRARRHAHAAASSNAPRFDIWVDPGHSGEPDQGQLREAVPLRPRGLGQESERAAVKRDHERRSSGRHAFPVDHRRFPLDRGYRRVLRRRAAGTPHGDRAEGVRGCGLWLPRDGTSRWAPVSSRGGQARMVRPASGWSGPQGGWCARARRAPAGRRWCRGVGRGGRFVRGCRPANVRVASLFGTARGGAG